MERDRIAVAVANARVAARVRELRIDAGLTMHDVADALGVSYQQVYKYETGQNRFSAGAIAIVARRLNVEPSAFYESVP